MKYIICFIFGILTAVSITASAGWLSSGIGGAVGAHMATSGIEGKVDTINSHIDALIKAIDNVKVCK